MSEYDAHDEAIRFAAQRALSGGYDEVMRRQEADQMMTIEQVSWWLATSTFKVRLWRLRGLRPTWVGYRRFYRRSDVRAFVEAHTVRGSRRDD